mmetsp:Transcript_28299/g.39786  ORF Transcript_28299/g.39786 Transcript_28299/m.39786 type:complete len:120 (-) Transcript_28299:1093-1452(-)
MACTQRDKLKFVSAGLVHQAQLREDLAKAFNVYMFGASNARPGAWPGDAHTAQELGSYRPCAKSDLKHSMAVRRPAGFRPTRARNSLLELGAILGQAAGALLHQQQQRQLRQRTPTPLR